MRLDHLELCNFGSHASFSRAFGPGLTGIIGANGAGKSTLLDAVRYLLGGAKLLPDKKEFCICDQAPKGAKSFVRGRFTHNEHSFEVTRFLRPSSPTAELLYENGKKLVGDEKVTDKIEEIIGLRVDLLAEVSMVEQLRLFAFMSDPPAKRREYFQKLFGIEKAAVLYDAITARRRQILVADYAPEIQNLQGRLEGARTRLSGAQGRLAILPPEEDLKARYDAATSQVAAAAGAEMRAQTKAALEVQTRALAPAAAALEQANAGLQAAKDRYSQARAAFTAAQEADTVLTHRLRKQELTKRMAELLEGVRAWEAVPAPPRYEHATVLEQQLASLAEDYHRANDLVTAYRSNARECPTCHASLESRAAEVAAAQTRLRELQQQILPLQADCQAFGHHRQVLAQRPAALDRLRKDIADVTLQLAKIPELPEVIPQVDAGAARRMHDDAAAVLEQCQRAVQGASAEDARLRGQVESLQRTLASLPDTAAAATAAEAAQMRDSVFRMMQERQALVGEMPRHQAEIAALEGELQRLDLLRRKDHRKREWAAFLDDLASPLHSTAAPAKMACERLVEMTQIVNAFLGHLRVPFQASFDESLTFTAVLPDGTTRRRLSPGQMVAVAVAVRFALNIVAAGGVLYLDEPTVYLDAARVQAFEAVLAGLRQYVSSQGLQCLLITHAAALAPLFDDVVRLAP